MLYTFTKICDIIMDTATFMEYYEGILETGNLDYDCIEEFGYERIAGLPRKINANYAYMGFGYYWML